MKAMTRAEAGPRRSKRLLKRKRKVREGRGTAGLDTDSELSLQEGPNHRPKVSSDQPKSQHQGFVWNLFNKTKQNPTIEVHAGLGHTKGVFWDVFPDQGLALKTKN